MIQEDTIKLLRECDEGVKMGVASIDAVLDYVSSQTLKTFLSESKNEHEMLGEKIKQLLDSYHDDGKEPNPMAKGMSWLKSNVKLKFNESDSVAADIITDGADMGIKSLNKYLNEYTHADESSKEIAKELIRIEEQLNRDIRRFL